MGQPIPRACPLTNLAWTARSPAPELAPALAQAYLSERIQLFPVDEVLLGQVDMRVPYLPHDAFSLLVPENLGAQNWDSRRFRYNADHTKASHTWEDSGRLRVAVRLRGERDHLSNGVVEEFELSTGSVAEVYWEDEDKELVIHFVDREGRDRGALSQAGLLTLVKQGSSLQLSAKSVLLDAGVPLPEKSVRLPVEVTERQLATGRAKSKAASVKVEGLS